MIHMDRLHSLSISSLTFLPHSYISYTNFIYFPLHNFSSVSCFITWRWFWLELEQPSYITIWISVTHVDHLRVSATTWGLGAQTSPTHPPTMQSCIMTHETCVTFRKLFLVWLDDDFMPYFGVLHHVLINNILPCILFF